MKYQNTKRKLEKIDKTNTSNEQRINIEKGYTKPTIDSSVQKMQPTSMLNKKFRDFDSGWVNLTPIETLSDSTVKYYGYGWRVDLGNLRQEDLVSIYVGFMLDVNENVPGNYNLNPGLSTTPKQNISIHYEVNDIPNPASNTGFDNAVPDSTYEIKHYTLVAQVYFSYQPTVGLPSGMRIRGIITKIPPKEFI